METQQNQPVAAEEPAEPSDDFADGTSSSRQIDVAAPSQQAAGDSPPESVAANEEEPTADVTEASPTTMVSADMASEVQPGADASSNDAGSETVDATVSLAAPAAPVADHGGMHSSGRAVNDPRVTAKPVVSVEVHTTLSTLFSGHEAPPVSVVARNIPRASNDPRGPRSGETESAMVAASEADDVPDAVNQ
jgi:ribonuclease E